MCWKNTDLPAIAPPKPIITKIVWCSSQSARRGCPCDGIKLFPSPSRTFVTNSIHVSDKQSVCTASRKHQITMQFAWLSFFFFIFSPFFAYFTSCVCRRNISLRPTVVKALTELGKWALILLLTTTKNILIVSVISLSFYSITVFSNCHILLREDADGPRYKPPHHISDLNLRKELGCITLSLIKCISSQISFPPLPPSCLPAWPNWIVLRNCL